MQRWYGCKGWRWKLVQQYIDDLELLVAVNIKGNLKEYGVFQHFQSAIAM